MRSSPTSSFETFRAPFVATMLEAQAAGAARNTFRGMASVYNTLIDAYMPTRILAGAFTRTLSGDTSRIKILWQHDPGTPIGVPTLLADRADGLEIQGKISKTTAGQDAIVLLEDQVITELSIGFEPVRQEFVSNQQTGVQERHILDLELFEVSLVTFAANRDAKIMSVHSALQSLPRALGPLVGPLLERFRAADPDEPLALLLPAVQFIAEVHAGKVLSARNKQLVADSLAALQASVSALSSLMEQAGHDDPEVQSATLSPTVDVSRFLRELEVQALDAGVLA
jgi:HK97 family phage prohead protease